MALLSPFDPFIMGGTLLAGAAVLGTLFGLYESHTSPIRFGAGDVYKRSLENSSVIFFFPHEPRLSRADMDVLSGMVVQPIPENEIGHNAYIYNEGANFSASGFIAGLRNREGIHFGNISVTLSSHPMQPVEGHWLFVDADVADERVFEGYQKLEKTVADLHAHRAVMWDLFARVGGYEA